MVLDSIKDESTNPRFYSRSECAAFRQSRTIPDHAQIWIGRCSASALGAYGTDVGITTPSVPKFGIGTVATFIVGYLAVQVFAMRAHPEHVSKSIPEIRPKQGDWSSLLSEIWPVTKDAVTWPPPATFVIGGRPSIATLMDRWRVGTEVQHSPQL
jgi:hypothetical protein